MKLHNLDRNTWFTLDSDPEQVPFFFDHIDGAYSLCSSKAGELYHFSANTEVTPYDDLDGSCSRGLVENGETCPFIARK